MDRWLQSFTSFFDLTVSGVSNCCPASLSSHNKDMSSFKSAHYQTGFVRTTPIHAAHIVPSERAYIHPAAQINSSGYEICTENIHNSESPSSPSERPPVSINIRIFNYPDQNLPSTGGYVQIYDQSVSSPESCAEAVPVGWAQEQDLARARRFGKSVVQLDNVQRGGPARNAGCGQRDEALAIHQAAERGAADALRIIIWYRHRRRHPSHCENVVQNASLPGSPNTRSSSDESGCGVHPSSLYTFTLSPVCSDEYLCLQLSVYLRTYQMITYSFGCAARSRRL